MRSLFLTAILALPAAGFAAPQFVAVDVYVSVEAPLAAWQFEFADTNRATTIVGVENGDAAVFGDALYYDRDAIGRGQAERVIVADYSLSADLPHGLIRLATLHLMVDGEPEFTLTLKAATARDGRALDATLMLEAQ